MSKRRLERIDKMMKCPVVADSHGYATPDHATTFHSLESDPYGTDAHAPGAKLDFGKLRPWLCIQGFSNALNEVAKVTTVGAEKYTPNGWMHVPNGQERYMDAFGRHMLKLAKGEVIDEDTGCYHMSQMIWNLLASFELQLRELENHDLRPEV